MLNKCLQQRHERSDFFCYYFRHIMFVNTLDLDEDQITFYDKFIKKTMKFKKVHIHFLATVEYIVI